MVSTFPNSGLAKFLRETQELVDSALDRYLPSDSQPPQQVHAAIRWSVFAGGKRFRPSLLLAVGEAFGAQQNQLISSACAVEMIHAYSLIHDDLPSMDDDDLRRGRATCHIRFGEATAILAGDALQTLAFQIVADDELLSAETRIKLVREISRAAGTPSGMVAGQARDLEAESRAVSAQELEQIHGLKTGALIIAAARCGAVIAGAPEKELSVISDYAAQLGLLFQITDDVLDVTATAETLGKTPGKDSRSDKATYPALHGIDAAREHAAAVHQQARAALDKLHQPTERLHLIADYILTRPA
jgi:geranylgeranyl diphosphate synthase, type II